jgi:hypothetical protein
MRILPFVAAAGAAAFICGTANSGVFLTSADQPAVGVGMICNTPEQAKQFLDLRADGIAADQAMKKVNDDAQNPRACGIAAIAFVPDKMVDAKPVNNKLLQVERINVIAGYDGSGWQHVPAMVQYAVMEGGGDGI